MHPKYANIRSTTQIRKVFQKDKGVGIRAWGVRSGSVMFVGVIVIDGSVGECFR